MGARGQKKNSFVVSKIDTISRDRLFLSTKFWSLVIVFRASTDVASPSDCSANNRSVELLLFPSFFSCLSPTVLRSRSLSIGFVSCCIRSVAERYGRQIDKHWNAKRNERDAWQTHTHTHTQAYKEHDRMNRRKWQELWRRWSIRFAELTRWSLNKSSKSIGERDSESVCVIEEGNETNRTHETCALIIYFDVIIVTNSTRVEKDVRMKRASDSLPTFIIDLSIWTKARRMNRFNDKQIEVLPPSISASRIISSTSSSVSFSPRLVMTWLNTQMTMNEDKHLSDPTEVQQRR